MLELSKAPGAVSGAFGLLGKWDHNPAVSLAAYTLAAFLVPVKLPKQIGNLLESSIPQGCFAKVVSV